MRQKGKTCTIKGDNGLEREGKCDDLSGSVLEFCAGGNVQYRRRIRGHAAELVQGGDGVLRKAAVEKAGLGHAGQGHDAQLPVVAFGHMVDGPLDGLFHGRLPPETVILTGVSFTSRDMIPQKIKKAR